MGSMNDAFVLAASIFGISATRSDNCLEPRGQKREALPGQPTATSKRSPRIGRIQLQKKYMLKRISTSPDYHQRREAAHAEGRRGANGGQPWGCVPLADGCSSPAGSSGGTVRKVDVDDANGRRHSPGGEQRTKSAGSRA